MFCIYDVIFSFVGLYCKIIIGCVKGKMFWFGDVCIGERFRYCWNVVYFDGNWFFLDVKWGVINGNNVRLLLYLFFFYFGCFLRIFWIVVFFFDVFGVW